MILVKLAKESRDQGAIDERTAYIDAMFVQAKGGGAEIRKKNGATASK